MMLETVDSNGLTVPMPDWQSVLNDELEIAAAIEHWRVITIEMRERGILSPNNAHAVRRLIMAYIVYDRASAQVAELGAVMKPKRGNPKGITRVNPYVTVMAEASKAANALEDDLGLSPRHRASVSRVQSKANRRRAADEYLKPIQGGKA